MIWWSYGSITTNHQNLKMMHMVTCGWTNFCDYMLRRGTLANRMRCQKNQTLWGVHDAHPTSIFQMRKKSLVVADCTKHLTFLHFRVCRFIFGMESHAMSNLKLQHSVTSCIMYCMNRLWTRSVVLIVVHLEVHTGVVRLQPRNCKHHIGSLYAWKLH